MGLLYEPNPDTPQAQLPRFNLPVEVTPQYVQTAIENALGGGSVTGTNYRISDGELQILNTDQNEYTPINTVGADGAQSLELHDAIA